MILVDPASLDESVIDAIRRLRIIAFDFDGVFTDNSVYVSQDGVESVRCLRSDGLGLAKLSAIGVDALIISTESNPVVTTRAKKLKLRCIQDCPEKLVALRDVVLEAGATLADAAFVGNDINDRSCLEAVGLPIVVADSHPDVLPLGRYRTVTRGGYGAVREICDMIVRVRTEVRS